MRQFRVGALLQARLEVPMFLCAPSTERE